MLPHVAPTSATAQASLALPAGTTADAAAVRPQLSAAALANLRAEVLLRLIETLLKHLPRGGDPSPGRDLLETLLTALKSLPGESGRKLADLLAKLPPELRSGVEKLIGAVLSAMPTRGLVEVVRNPDGPQARTLATLLAANLDTGDLPPTRVEDQRKPLGLDARQLAAVSRHGPQQDIRSGEVPGDARALQAMLKRIFDADGGGKLQPLAARAVETTVTRQGLAEPARLPAGENATARTDPRLPAAATGTGDEPADTVGHAPRHDGGTEEIQTATPALRREERATKAQLAHSAGQALARSVLQAVARDVTPALLMQAVAQLVENLTPEETRFLRVLLARPLEPTDSQAPGEAATGQAEAETTAMTENGKVRSGIAQPVPAVADETTGAGDALPMPPVRETVRPNLAEATPDRLPLSVPLREGVPLAFVPYLPAEEDLEWPAGREGEKDETDEEQADGNDGQEGEAKDDPSGDEPETPDMARRREKTAEMVGITEPGLVFYQKLSDYWT